MKGYDCVSNKHIIYSISCMVRSTIIFNLYIEEAIKKYNLNLDTGIKIQGLKIAMLRFTEDNTLGSNKKEFEQDQLNFSR